MEDNDKRTVINGYMLIGELKNDNSGYAKWGFAVKDGCEVFIKQFLSPVYPIDENILTADQLNSKRNICYNFEKRKGILYKELRACSTGNIVPVIHFFRFKSKYYIITEKIETTSLTIDEIADLPIDKKLLILKIILYNISVLHEHGIIHADIKPDNILIKETKAGFYTAKLIDFDSSFFEKNGAERMSLEGDLVYFSPEAYMAIANEEHNRTNITHKIDIFALGILFHQYLTGKLPLFNKSEYDYLFEAVLDEGEISTAPELDGTMRKLISQMLDKDPNNRPDAKTVFDTVSELMERDENKKSKYVKATPSLKNTMRVNLKEKTTFLHTAGDL